MGGTHRQIRPITKSHVRLFSSTQVSAGGQFTSDHVQCDKLTSYCQSSHTTVEALFFWALFAVVGIFIIYPFLRSLFWGAFRPVSRHLPTWLGGGPGGGGGGGGGWTSRPRFWGGGRLNDPPPPYSPRNTPRSKPSTTENESWRPGFWTGQSTVMTLFLILLILNGKYLDQSISRSCRRNSGDEVVW